ncbi:RNA-binding S4 domain-containing protein [Serpentinicella sp. ANB-PHB4]|uniref:RNA-binding S4 domain-containing protein n=1 Tax=Serpentinicella sp. ANB-PHB4 TaxID=3074076 RepID=UPI0028616A2E|nr:RNA-binding S4 domain-containing protein [Serpentinicella sp. ANB-PHB4]MDR5658914.1 RNA-binding S4 domain-containing protein [Serpentinicella sp. ANB-PHB4]
MKNYYNGGILLIINIDSEYIKLDQLLKLSEIAVTGGEAKHYILEGLVKVNGEVVVQRGKKIKDGDIVQFDNERIEVKQNK